jgi:ferredoxin-type protein NapG
MSADAKASGRVEPSDARKQEQRRKLLQAAAVGCGVVGLSMAGLLPVVLREKQRLRPPGALDEKDFLASCIKCGQCVQVCPVSALEPADLVDGFGVGVPFIEPRKQACDFSCDVAQCILACPTGALTYQKPDFLPVREGLALPAKPVLLAKELEPEPTLNLNERMGVARLARPEACLSVRGEGVKGSARGDSFKGRKRWTEVDRWTPQKVKDHPYDLARCDLCVRECPIKGAISIEDVAGKPTPVVHDACVGCGVCEMMCPAEPAAIVIEARAPWRAS